MFTALETFVIIALYKSTFTIPYHTTDAVGWVSGRAFGLQKLSDGVVICLEQGADCLHMVQLMSLHPKTTSSLASFKFRLVFTARCYASAVLAMALCLSVCLSECLSVCLSVCPSQVVLLKRLNVGSHKQHHTIVQGL